MMYYCDEYSGVGIPRGDIHGIHYRWRGNEKVWSEGMANVGLFKFLTSPSGGGGQ
ncbi:MAG: hypothetical protein IKR48_07065 [Kiritimatiellae bacterium]|nr:hypothetical protein [Kiritimatiellia bacterium]